MVTLPGNEQVAAAPGSGHRDMLPLMGTDASGSTEAVLAANTLGPTIRLRAPQAAIDLDARGIDHPIVDPWLPRSEWWIRS
jgi:hypothetical protein